MKIVTIHPYYNLNSIFIDKEIGTINRLLGKEYKLDSEVWCLRKNNELNFTFEDQKRLGFKSVLSMIFLFIKNKKSVKIVNLFHISPITIILTILLKIISFRLIIYIKTDSPLLEDKSVLGLGVIDMRNKIKYLKFIKSIFFPLTTVIGFEHKQLLRAYQESFPHYADKFVLNTSSASVVPKYLGNLKKINAIVLVGRFGASQKNYELFIDFLEKNDCKYLNGRKIFMCGSMTDDFSLKLKSLLQKKPFLKDVIKYLGFIADRDELYKLMSSCKIFLHTARWEGDTNIQYDAMVNGCFMLSTDIGNIRQNYPSNYINFIDLDGESLDYQLRNLILTLDDKPNSYFLNIQNHFLKYFQWKDTMSNVYNKISI